MKIQCSEEPKQYWIERGRLRSSLLQKGIALGHHLHHQLPTCSKGFHPGLDQNQELLFQDLADCLSEAVDGMAVAAWVEGGADWA